MFPHFKLQFALNLTVHRRTFDSQVVVVWHQIRRSLSIVSHFLAQHHGIFR
jgi:hypothetical protein